MTPTSRLVHIAGFAFTLAVCVPTLRAQGRLLIVDQEFRGDLVLAENNFDLIREGSAGDDESLLAGLRQDISTRIIHRPAAEVERWLFSGLSAEAEQKLLESFLRLKIESIDELCGLTEAQKRKLQIAGDADIRRLLDLAARISQPVDLLGQPQKAADDRAWALLLVKLSADYHLLDDRQLFARSLKHAMSHDQWNRYDEADREQRTNRYLARIERIVRKLATSLKLEERPRDKLVKLLATCTPAPRQFGRCDEDVILFQLAELKEATIRSLFTREQWRDLQERLNSVREAGEALRECGLLSDDRTGLLPEADAAARAGIELSQPERPEKVGLNGRPIDDHPRPRRPYGPEQAAGPPDSPAAADAQTAWASKSADGQPEWLTCYYPQVIDIHSIVIHENCCPGAISKVTVFDADDEEMIVWEADKAVIANQPRQVTVIPVRPQFRSAKIKIYLDSPAVQGWNEIDAVGLKTADEEITWAELVEASSTYADVVQPAIRRRASSNKRSWGVEQVTGAPDTFQPGDQSTAWASQSTDNQAEWLLCHYADPVDLRAVVIHESFNPGAVTKVSVFDAEDHEVTAWEGVDPTQRKAQFGISVIPVKVDFKVSKIRIAIDSPAVPGFNEIDAVGLRDLFGNTQWAEKVEASSVFGTQLATAQAVIAQDELQRLRALDAEIKEIRNELKRLKQLEAEVEELKRLLKDRRPQ